MLMTTSVERHAFTLPDGTLSVLAAGPADGDRILLLHGIPASAELFRDVLAILAEAGYRALAPDMPGYGKTRLADDADYSLLGVADLYAAWLESEDLNPVWLVGHDLGCAVAQLIAVRHPHLITHLALGDGPIGDSFPVFSVKIGILAAKLGLWKPLAALKLIPNPYMSWELRRGFGDGSKLTTDMKQRIFWDSKVSTLEGRHEIGKSLKQLRSDENLSIVGQLKSIYVPTLVLWGERDRHQPANLSGKRLHAALPDGTAFEIMPSVGHFAPAEDPALYAQTLLHWRQNLIGKK